MRMTRRAACAILGMGMSVTIFWGTANPAAALAEVRQVEVTGQYFIGTEAKNLAEAREKAHKDALRMAAEQVSALVKSYSEIHNTKLTRDEIQIIAAAILSVKDMQYSYDTDSENNITVLCHIIAAADSDDITEDVLRQLTPIRNKAQIAECEMVLDKLIKEDNKENGMETWEKLIALDPNNSTALKFAFHVARYNGANAHEFQSHIERVYASHTHDFEACAYLAELFCCAKQPDYERAVFYADKCMEEAKKRYSMEEIRWIANSTYVDKDLQLHNTAAGDIYFNPICICYAAKWKAMEKLVGGGYYIEVASEDASGRSYIRYKSDYESDW